jgi:hypothetical protein
VNGEIPGDVVLFFFVFVFKVGRGERHWCVLGRTEDFSEVAIMETKGFPMKSLDERKLPYAEGEG